MPWSRLHAYTSSDSGDILRRRSTSFDPAHPQTRSEHILPTDHFSSQGDAQPRVDISHPAPNSIEQLDAVDGASASKKLPSAAIPDPLPRPYRFSLLKFRHASDSQLSRTAKDQLSMGPPPLPASKSVPNFRARNHIRARLIILFPCTAPSIITTAPTLDQFDLTQKRKSTFTLPRRRKAPDPFRSLSSRPSRKSLSEGTSNSGQESALSTPGNQSARMSRITFDEPERLRGTGPPPAYGDDTNSSLALPISRLSESSRSEGSLGDNRVYATTTTTHTVSTTTTFFRLPRRKRKKGPLFPLPLKDPPLDSLARPNFTPQGSTSVCASESPSRQSPSRTPPISTMYRQSHVGRGGDGLPPPLPSSSNAALAASSQVFAAPALSYPRRDSTTSAQSGRSSPVLAPPALGRRGRSSTKGSLKRVAHDEPLPTPPLPQSSRTSTSTTGRSSLGGLFGLSRLRQNSEPQSARHGSGNVGLPGTPASTRSKSHSFSLTRDLVVVPQRQDGDTPAKYLVRLEEAVSRGVVATILSKSDDEFSKNVLRSYMRGFGFFGYPLDMSIRKLLMEVELPKETQQIDRVLQSFANRYHECNPGVYASPGMNIISIFKLSSHVVLDEAYFIALSILILHTDVFNKNNKHKMQKTDYVKNAKGQGVAEEILECFYDNISYTPFIHVEDDVDINGERVSAHRSRKGIFAKPSNDPLKKPSREPVDPYTLILDNKLESLRPSLKDVMNLEDPYNYLGTCTSLNLADLHKTFFKSGVLQILSSRSRPEAFMSPETMANPAVAHPGVVDIKTTKVGILWRKDMKKKKARSPWQEWGAILTGSQLYFFRNTAWIKSLMHQYDTHHKLGFAGAPVIFKPPLEHFKPEVLMSTEDAVALVDSTYKKHKNAFIFVRHGGFEETFLADNEADANDWLAKLNYASAFRSAGVRMRGLIGGNYDGQRARSVRRMDSSNSTQSFHTATGEVLVRSGRIDAELSRQIQIARRQIMTEKIAEAEEKLESANKQLDAHLRNARHLQILAPIQSKTREQVILAAGGMAARIKWLRMEMWRTRCHKDILALDLEEETKPTNDHSMRNENVSNAALSAATPSIQESLKADSQAGYLSTPQTTSRRGSATRPSTQPSPGRNITKDDMFQSSLQSSPPGSQHKPRGSWELPPLSFEPTRSSLKSGSSVKVSAPAPELLTHHASLGSVRGNEKPPDLIDIATTLATPTPSLDDDEHEILVEAGVFGPDSSTPNAKGLGATSDGEREKDLEKFKSSEADFVDGKSKVRRSLHRTLREAHVPTHHRSRKGKDSASSTGMAEDALSVAESEGLTRGAGSFTVHGKKASVITFGSEWHDMSPEERLKLRKSVQGEESKLLAPSAVDDESSSTISRYNAEARPTSAKSTSTTTTRSLAPKDDGEDSSNLLKRVGHSTPREESHSLQKRAP